MTTSPTPAPGRHSLAAFTEALASRLPDRWTPSSTPLTTSDARNNVHARLWDLAHASWALQTVVYDRAGLLRGPGGRELLVLPRPHPHAGQYIVAALLPEALGSAYDHEDLAPHGIAVDPDPARAASAVTDRLLPRYDRALRQLLAGIDSTADLPFTSHRTDSPVLRHAVRTLLLVAELRLADESYDVLEALAGGGEYVCDRVELDYDMAPLVEAAAVQAVLSAAGLPTGSLFDPGIPARLRRLSARSPADQYDVLRRAAESLAEPVPSPRLGAARARTRILSTSLAAAALPARPTATASRTSVPGR
ncbi:hypothetical protein ABT263_21040 [Kitasatospora sp. NPDC001603]|uniref:hypothetical protein n=1 Tax=Kitasatospora sp. NPDC001603 TaxID=3154388 RepID=UPI003332BD75